MGKYIYKFIMVKYF